MHTKPSDLSDSDETLMKIKAQIMTNLKLSQFLGIYHPQWLAYVKDPQGMDFYQPAKINLEDFDLRTSKFKQLIIMEPTLSETKLNQLKASQEIFRDNQFAAGTQSLYGNFPREYCPKQWEQIIWKPLHEKFSDGIVFTKNLISPKDIEQNNLGDCYFLAGLAALAEVPERITDLFLLTQTNKHHYFSVKILYRGKWKRIHLDDMVPFIKERPAFSAASDNALWVILLEKAWAKLYGSYKQIEAGYPQEPLHDLTGAPVLDIFFNNPNKQEQVWAILQRASQKNYPMIAVSKDGYTKNNIALSHAYTVLDTFEIEFDSKLQKLVQLRNPWKLSSYNGKWSYSDQNWKLISKQEKARLRYKSQTDSGIVYMDYSTFYSNFNYMGIAETLDKPSYVYESYNDYDIEGVYYTIQIGYEGQYYLMIDKTSVRTISQIFGEEKASKYQYPGVQLYIKMIEWETEGEHLSDYIKQQKSNRTFSQKYELKPGKYIVFAKIHFNKEYQKDFLVNLAVYSEHVCGIYISSKSEVKKVKGDEEWYGQFFKYIAKPALRSYITGQKSLVDKNPLSTALKNLESLDSNQSNQSVSEEKYYTFDMLSMIKQFFLSHRRIINQSPHLDFRKSKSKRKITRQRTKVYEQYRNNKHPQKKLINEQKIIKENHARFTDHKADKIVEKTLVSSGEKIIKGSSSKQLKYNQQQLIKQEKISHGKQSIVIKQRKLSRQEVSDHQDAEG